jgi:hypothetical protein
MADQDNIPTETIAVPSEDPVKKKSDEPVHAEEGKIRDGKDEKDTGDEMVCLASGLWVWEWGADGGSVRGGSAAEE